MSKKRCCIVKCCGRDNNVADLVTFGRGYWTRWSSGFKCTAAQVDCFKSANKYRERTITAEWSLSDNEGVKIIHKCIAPQTKTNFSACLALPTTTAKTTKIMPPKNIPWFFSWENVYTSNFQWSDEHWRAIDYIKEDLSNGASSTKDKSSFLICLPFIVGF